MKPIKLAVALAAILITTVMAAPAVSADTSESVHLTATALGPRPEIAIELSATELDFGQLYNGETSDPQDLKVTNVGLKDIDVTATAKDKDGQEPLFVPGMLIDGASYANYSATLAANESDDTQLTLHMPDDYASLGEVSGCATFWAEEHSGSLVSVVDFTADVTSGVAPLTVQFTDLSTNSPTNWTWDFGDGSNSTEQNPSHTYTENGTYTVSLTACNSTDCDDEVKTAYISVGGETPGLGADFSADTTSGTVPLTVQFTDLSTNSPTNWTWDFGDGSNSTEQNPSHTYSAEGTYTVTLSACNSTGCDEEVKNSYITVSSEVGTSMDWVTFQGDNYHTGVTTEQAAVSEASLSWSAQASTSGMAGFDVAPIVADGAVFEIGQNGAVIAYDVNTGAVLWQRSDLVINSGLGFQLSTPVYNEGTLYVALIMGTKQGFGVFALDADDGHTAWSARFLEGWNVQPNTPITYDEGKLFLGCWFSNSTAGHYYCLDSADGSTEWDRVASSGKSYYGAGAAVIGDYLVFGEDSGNVISVNKYTGDTVQELSSSSTFGIGSSMIRASVTYSSSSGMVLFTMQSGKCCAIGFDATTGTFDTSKKWVATIGTYSTSTPAVYNGKVYVGSGTFSAGENYLFCLDEATGATQWQLSANGGVASSPVISTSHDEGDGEGYIYFTTNAAAGRVYCVDADGNEKWHYEPPSGQTNYVLHGVAIYDGKVFFGNDSGYIFALGGA